jgi:hypothetical protein
MTFGDWASAAQNIAQAFAIFAGGAWAYWKFVRGRTFHRRAELAVEACIVSGLQPRVVRAKITLTNTGASDIPLRAKVVRVFAFTPGEADPDSKEPDWRHIASAGAFRAHEWVESQEQIADDVLIEIETARDKIDALALRATCIVLGKRKRTIIGRKRSTAWTSQTVIPLEHQPTSTDVEGAPHMPDKEREYQRDVDEDEAKRIEREERQREVTEEEAQRIEKESKEK